MSFSSDTKIELARVEAAKKCCMLAEIAGFIRVSGSVKLVGGGKMKLVIATEHPAVARHYKKLIKEYFDVDATLEIEEGTSGLTKGRQYILTLDDREDQRAELIMRETGILMIREGMNYISDGIYSGLIRSKCCRKSYLRGAFLGIGTMSNPEKGYHYELVCATEVLANDLKKLLNSFVDINAKVVQRKKSYIVYVKDAGQVGDLLNIMGAHQQYFELENIRMKKDLRNQTNRLINCDTANLDKTLNAAERQLAAIELIETEKGLGFLPQKLQDVAVLRKENREATLQELAEMCDPPMKKSGLNNRFRKIEEIAKKIEESRK
ncbi:MAG: DNA-binding protein WhiA [Firmicutes bacterium]|nr:DNA-binding protein WhiA [Bacillota bacterium]MBQ3122741.1 DNA-binding protein WhiA [Bacillota bacterium]MBQ9972273.1 DNA-binding protein WhiA [Bacillota bacterium]